MLGLALALTAAVRSADTNALTLSANLLPDRLAIRVGNELFTEYLFGADLKYPYFHPVNGPSSGRSVTIHRTGPYPHHSSLFFGCDRVNGGNYWQEGLERGRIAAQALRLVRDRGPRIEFEQDCVWERPGAEAPFNDTRRIAVSAPDANTRFIDFAITLTARTPVKIERTNHSLFAARVAPELSVKGGGVLVNAQGDTGEAGTFGKPASWAEFRGTRDGVVEGLAILSHPRNRGFPEPWFTRDYGFLSPTPLQWLSDEGLNLARGEQLRFRYRVVVHAGAPDRARLERWFADWSAAAD